MNIGNKKLIEKLESLVDERQDWLFRFAYIRIGQREDAEDIVQEVLLAAFKKLKEGLKVEELDRYIIRSVSNACRDYFRQKRPQYITINEATSMPIGNNDKQIHEEFLRISKLLEDIPQEQAEIVRMKCYDNLTFREIAELEELPEATVKSRYRYAIQHIQQQLRKEKRV